MKLSSKPFIFALSFGNKLVIDKRVFPYASIELF